MLRFLPFFLLPLLGAAGLLGDLVQSSGTLLGLVLLSSLAVVAELATGRPRKRSQVLVVLLICLFLYAAQLALLLYPRTAEEHPDAEMPRVLIAPRLAIPQHLLRSGRQGRTAAKEGAAASSEPSLVPAAVATAEPVVHFGGIVTNKTMRTISVVLPCAEERGNALNTVQRFCERTPDAELEEIVVVDDGSDPPLAQIFRSDKRRLDKNPRCRLRILRHESTIGLMAAKLTGGKEAKGDVVAFFDCHCSPKPGWEKEILAKVTQNPRRMVVPAITDLDLDTFDEAANTNVNAKCYLSLDCDFKWFDDESDFIPTISGGLVAMGREWFNLTGGFDEEMRGWGGENLDQSLRTWLCGREIVRAKGSRVAHMWRTGDPRTRSAYQRPAKPTDNRGRVAAAWFDAFRAVDRCSKREQDVTSYGAVKRRLGCKPFSYFLYRFRRVYVEGGVIPKEVFRLREKASQLCLSRDLRYGITIAAECNRGDTMQTYCLGNMDPDSGTCCSGLKSYGMTLCMDWFDEKGGHYYPCDISGRNKNQHYHLQASGRILHGQDGCLMVEGTKVWQRTCGGLEPGQGVFERLHQFSPPEWQLYQQEVALHRFAEEMPDLPDN